MACKLREECRKLFKSLGLSYKDINKEDIDDLCTMISYELKIYKVKGGEHAKQMDMKLSKIRKKDKKFHNFEMVHCQIQVDGSYFKRRECITFATSGFIGFAGELSDVNVMPILKAFKKWCYHLRG